MMMVIFFAIEIWVFGTLCAYFSARTSAGKNVVVIAAFAVAGLGVMAVEMTRNEARSVWSTISSLP